MKRIEATSEQSKKALSLLTKAQDVFVRKLTELNRAAGFSGQFSSVEWYRNNGLFGGGERLEAPKGEFFNTASVNFSQVQYESDETKSLRSASALSTIIHPNNPFAPSFHMHVSLTEMKTGQSYWRIMADLNPSIPNEKDKAVFDRALLDVARELYLEGKTQGDKYFYIPTLNKHRGISHFYLEKFTDGSLARPFLEKMIDTYVNILVGYIKKSEITPEQKQVQEDYHTLYFYQVLTLDRGTTSGLLVHNENDTGILASLPNKINKKLLKSWEHITPHPQNELVSGLIKNLKDANNISDQVKCELASAVRSHFKKYPEALNLQASGNVIPPTVQNHK